MSNGYDKYRDAYRRLVRYANRNGLSVRQVGDYRTRDYIGMNSEAATAMGFGVPDNMVYVDKNLSWEDKYRTLKHELNEVFFMQSGDPYWRAHKKSLRRERRIVYPQDLAGKLHELV